MDVMAFKSKISLLILTVFLIAVMAGSALAADCEYQGVHYTQKLSGASYRPVDLYGFSDGYLSPTGFNATNLSVYYPDSSTLNQNLTNSLPLLNTVWDFSLKPLTLESGTSYLYINFTSSNSTMPSDTEIECFYFKIDTEPGLISTFLRFASITGLSIGVIILLAIFGLSVFMALKRENKINWSQLIVTIILIIIVLAVFIAGILSIFT